MSAARAFIDTNVVLYLLSGDRRKADLAEAVVAAGGVVSVQVLNEFCSVARRKIQLSWEEIHEVLGAVRASCEVVPLTLAEHDEMLKLAERHGFAVYDALIVSAALAAGCDVLHTEDMQHGFLVDGRLKISNPFA